jgi:hypothetical protein
MRKQQREEEWGRVRDKHNGEAKERRYMKHL